MIEDYITSIGYGWINPYDGSKSYTFYGDGIGDFEQCKNSAKIEVVQDYIEYCQRQIELAHEYIKLHT